jgi:hypothetical protein
MNFSALTTNQIILIIAAVVVVIACIVGLKIAAKRRTQSLRARFGDAEYSRAVKEAGNQRRAEEALEKRADRVEAFHIRPLFLADRRRFLESWRGIQARFVDTPGGAIMEADQLLGDVMIARGYPMSEFEQRAADISVDHPQVIENYRAAHQIAVNQLQGKANTEDLRKAMIHYRTLFDELANEKEVAKAAHA